MKMMTLIVAAVEGKPVSVVIREAIKLYVDRRSAEQHEDEAWTDPEPWFYTITKTRTPHPLPHTSHSYRPRTRAEFKAESSA